MIFSLPVTLSVRFGCAPGAELLRLALKVGAK